MVGIARADGSRLRLWGLGGLFLLHSLPFLTRPVLLGGDEPHYALMTHSLAADHDLDLDADYGKVEQGSKAAGTRFAGRALAPHVLERGGRRTFAHALGLPLLAAPGVLLLAWIAPAAAPDLLLASGTLAITFVALLAGISLLGELAGSPLRGAVVGLGVYFGSPLWFYSRTFFADPYQWAFCVLAVWCLRTDRLVWAGTLLGLAFFCKETALVPASAILGAYVLSVGARRAWRCWAVFAAGLGLWLWRGHWLFGDALATAQPFQLGDGSGAPGVLFDPRHGLLPFAPVALCALAVVAARRGAVETQTTALAAGRKSVGMRFALAGALSAAGTLALTAAWVDWAGGACYGPRLLLLAVPALAVPIGVSARRWSERPLARRSFLATAAAGFALGLLAATDPFPAAWGPSVPDLVRSHPARAVAALLLATAAGWSLDRRLAAHRSLATER